MDIKIQKPLSFIQKNDLVSFELVTVNGAHFVRAGKFKQLVKESERAIILASQEQHEAPKTPEKDRQESVQETPADQVHESETMRTRRGKRKA